MQVVVPGPQRPAAGLEDATRGKQLGKVSTEEAAGQWAALQVSTTTPLIVDSG